MAISPVVGAASSRVRWLDAIFRLAGRDLVRSRTARELSLRQGEAVSIDWRRAVLGSTGGRTMGEAALP